MINMEANSGDKCDTTVLNLRSAVCAGTSNFVTASQDVDILSPCNTGVESSLTFDSAPSSSSFFSARIEQMMQAKSGYASELEFEIQSSKDHWSELTSLDATNEGRHSNSEVFQKLRKEWGDFFYDYGDRLKVGRKIAEGAQADIFEAEIEYPNGNKVEYVLKVFKPEGCSLQDLQKQWPREMLQRIDGGGILTRKGGLHYDATLLPDGRFAFRMQRGWGDLRKLIDVKMLCNSNQCMPFKEEEVYCIMVDIADAMRSLHGSKLVHRDLKASNVLIYPFWESEDLKAFNPTMHRFRCDISDYECTFGVVGTGFWRAPEILLAIKKRDIKSHIFTEKSDVYSYGMTCYEILTGSIPLEDIGRSNYDYVLCGRRPKLPENIKPWLKVLLSRCWHEDALKRPTFQEIFDIFQVEVPSVHGLLYG